MYDETIGLATGKVGEFELESFSSNERSDKILQSPRSKSPARVWEYIIETGRFVDPPTEGVQALSNLVKVLTYQLTISSKRFGSSRVIMAL